MIATVTTSSDKARLRGHAVSYGLLTPLRLPLCLYRYKTGSPASRVCVWSSLSADWGHQLGHGYTTNPACGHLNGENLK